MALRHHILWTLERSGFARPLWAFLACRRIMLALCLILVTNPLHAAEPEFVKTITNGFNTTGKVITLPLPLKDGETLLGEVTVRVNPDDSLLVSLPELKQRLQSTLNGASKLGLERLSAQGGFVALADVKAAGVNLTFDKGLQELRLEVATDLRLTSDISVGGRSTSPVASSVSQPAKISGYLNLMSGFDYVWGSDMPGVQSTPLSGIGQRMGFEAVTRLYGIVLENRFLYEGNVDANICPTGARCIYQHEAGFKRQS